MEQQTSICQDMPIFFSLVKTKQKLSCLENYV